MGTLPREETPDGPLETSLQDCTGPTQEAPGHPGWKNAHQASYAGIISSTNPPAQMRCWMHGIFKGPLADEVPWQNLFLLTPDILAPTSNLESVINPKELISGF